eukprot:7775081-Alexandrium_andersonii.AAC.1
MLRIVWYVPYACADVSAHVRVRACPGTRVRYKVPGGAMLIAGACMVMVEPGCPHICCACACELAP